MSDIAITGISMRCSEANNVDEFSAILKEGKVCVGPPAEKRILISGFSKKETYFPFGYINGIDEFDPQFFNISKTEADAINPAHRLILQAVCEAVENSGMSLKNVANNRTGLFVTVNQNFYNFLYQSPSPELDFIGGMNAVSSGRIAHLLNITGPVFNIDTACSSSLVAIHEAVQKLKNHEIDTAIVAGARVIYEFYEKSELHGNAILSSDGMCRAFDEKADGTSGGEGVAAMILKRREEAEDGKEIIHAIIKGTGINHDGSSSNGLTAPSPKAQKELLLQTAQIAKIGLHTVGYIETHGTGTKLGDPIEYKAIQEAFASSSDTFKVRLGTLKPNIGHLDNMAGIFGLIKALLVVKENRFFPLANFQKLNEFIVNDQRIELKADGEEWKLQEGEKRRAGISAFGLSGTNAHVIIEEYQTRSYKGSSPVDHLWVKASAKNKQVLSQYVDNISRSIKEANPDQLTAICNTLNMSRSDFDHRISFLGKDKAELLKNIEKEKKVIASLQAQKQETKVIFLFLSDILDNDMLKSINFTSASSFFKDISLDTDHDIDNTVVFQKGIYDYLQYRGIEVNQILCQGEIAQIVRRQIQKGSLMETSYKVPKKKTPIDWGKIEQILAVLSKQEPLLLVVGGDKGNLDRIKNITRSVGVQMIDLVDKISQGWETLWAILYKEGIRFKWEEFYKDQTFFKAQVPSYPFEKTSCWNPIKNPLVFSGKMKVDTTVEPSVISNPVNMEQTVINILGETLQNDALTLEDDFFELGGNSIVGIQFINRINDLYKVDLKFDELYDCYSISQIIDLINDKQPLVNKDHIPGTSPDQTENNDQFPLTNTQLRLWIESQSEEGSIAYNINQNYQIKGAFHIAHFEKSLNLLINNHEALRLVFNVNEEGEVYQKILTTSEVNFSLEFINAEDELNEYQESEMIRELYKQPFDLETGPLMRCSVIQFQKDLHIVVLSFHHLISDGWSAGIFLNELMSNYVQLNIEEELYFDGQGSNAYRNYLKWFHENTMENNLVEHKDYWKEKLKEPVPLLDLGANNNTKSFQGAISRYIFDSKQLMKFKELASKNKTTLFVILMAGIRSYLFRLTQQNCIIGTPISGRHKKEFENIIGLFLNTLPLKTTIGYDLTFNNCIQGEKQTVTEALLHQIYPYDKILEDVNREKEAGFTLFNVMVVLQNQNNRFDIFDQAPNSTIPVDIEIEKGIDIEDKPAQFDLTFTFFETDEALELELNYNKDTFGRGEIDSLIQNYVNYFTNAIGHSEKPISEVDIISEETITKIKDFNREIVFKEEDTLIDQWKAQVAKTPNRIALSFDQNEYSYKELDDLSDQFAYYLSRECSIQEGESVGVELNKSEWLVVSVLSIFKIGAIYVPIDPDYPEKRIHFIKKDAKCKLVIVEKIIDSFKKNMDVFEGKTIESPVSCQNVAYIIYTSGTTGNPKGVLVGQKSIAHYIKHQSLFYKVDEDDRFLLFSGISFDASIEQMFLPLTNGSQLFITNKDLIIDAERAIEFLIISKITHLHAVPSYLKHIKYNEKLSLKRIVSGGEEFNKIVFEEWGEKITVYNKYGPTEITISAIQGEASKYKSLNNIGNPIAGANVYILDANHKILPIGVSGEIYIGGIGVAKGYLNQKKLTKEKFIDNPYKKGDILYKTGDLGKWMPDGTIEFLGRIDHQIKIRGVRIEPNEIIRELNKINGIQSSTVALKEIEGEMEMIAYYTGENDITSSDIQKQLIKNLPPYILPSFYLYLDELPLTPNGKVDRDSLPLPNQLLVSQNNTYTPPENEVEKRIVEIWHSIFTSEQIGTNDNFFTIGGNSMKAVKVLFKINNEFGTALELKTIFMHPTVGELASHIIYIREQENLISQKDKLNEIEL